MAIDPKVIEKIQKLLNLKEGAEAVGSMHEAENAAARLQDLLFKYNLDLDDVKKSKIEAKAEMDKVNLDVSDMQDKRESNWIPELYNAVGINMLCEVRVSSTRIYVLGHKHNVSLVLYIAEQLVAKVRIAEKEAWKLYDATPQRMMAIGIQVKEKRGTFRRGFLRGCGIGIRRKLEDERRKAQQEGNPFALMIISKKQELDEYLIEQGWKSKPKTELEIKKEQEGWDIWWNSLSDKEKKAQEKRWDKMGNRKGPRQTNSTAGYSEGIKAGSKMNINQGLGETKASKHIG